MAGSSPGSDDVVIIAAVDIERYPAFDNEQRYRMKYGGIHATAFVARIFHGAVLPGVKPAMTLWKEIMHIRRVLLPTAVLFLLQSLAVAAPPLKALIVDGQNNHAWKETTPVLKR